MIYGVIVPSVLVGMRIIFNYQEDKELKQTWRHHQDWRKYRTKKRFVGGLL